MRRQQAVQQLTAGKTDASSRLLDTNRLIQAVAVAARPPAPPPTRPVAVAAVQEEPVQAPPRPEPVRVFRSEPVEVARPQVTPSFDCRSARTRGERMICSEPALAAADRRMAAAFERALDQAPNPRALMADQNRWLSLRDDIAPDYEGVMGLYQDRIAELRRRDY